METRKLSALLLLVAIAVAGCGSGTPPPPDPNDPNAKKNVGKPGMTGPGTAAAKPGGAAAGATE
jgi:hypothetical protein